MTRRDQPRLLTPPREEEEIYPYRRVWPSIMIETGVLFVITMSLYIMVGYLRLRPPESLNRPVNTLVALSPALLWMVFSLWRERTVPEPRPKLIGVFVISALVANAVGVPTVTALKTEQWLPFLGIIGRIIGYAVTVGIVQELLKYLVVRYTVWPGALRIRLDAVAYCAAAAIGYATALNLHFAFGPVSSPDIVALRVFSNATIHLSAGVLLAYGLAETRFNPRSFLIMPVALLVAAGVVGLAISARSSLINAKFFLGVSAIRPIFGFGFSLMVISGALAVAIFLFHVAERGEREAIAGHTG